MSSSFMFDPQQTCILKVILHCSAFTRNITSYDLHNQINEMRTYFATSGTQAVRAENTLKLPR